MKTSFKIKTEEGWLIDIGYKGLNVWFYTDNQYAEYLKQFELDQFIIRKKIRAYFKKNNIKTKLFPEK